MFSLNVPVPGEVRRLAGELRPHLGAFDSIRDRHTLVAKRLDDTIEGGRARVEGRARRALADAPAFEARVTGIDFFAEPTAGTAPVVYLEIESPGLFQVHEHLVDVFGTLDGVEGPEYTPHVTLARGGPMEAAERLADREVDPVTWTVSELHFFDVRYREWVGKVSLPG
jgi:2'-5' RNA ligase